MFKHSNKIDSADLILTADVGGSHITTGLVRAADLSLDKQSVRTQPVRAKNGDGKAILTDFITAFKASLDLLDGRKLCGIAIAMPGPFLYEAGIFKISALDKYGALYGLNFRQFLYDHLEIPARLPIFLKNDADCFGLGAYQQYGHQTHERLIGITLGTGLGSAFIEKGKLAGEGAQVPEEGNLFHLPLTIGQNKQLTRKDLNEQGDSPVMDHTDDTANAPILRYSHAEDLISSRGILRYVNTQLGATNGRSFADVAVVAAEARKSPAVDNAASICREAFDRFGLGLGSCLKPWVSSFGPTAIVIGGGIANAQDLFMPAMQSALSDTNPASIIIVKNEQMDALPLIGAAAALLEAYNENHGDEDASQGTLDRPWRKTHQPVLPQTVQAIVETHTEQPGKPNATHSQANPATYEIYPWTSLGHQKIKAGFEGLAGWVKDQVVNNAQTVIALDGYAGVDWTRLQEKLSQALKQTGIRAVWLHIAAFKKDSQLIEQMVAPFLGETTSVWGTQTNLTLKDFFDTVAINEQLTAERLTAMGTDVTIVVGTGAGLIPEKAPIVFVELPKNEIQYRLQSGVADNLYTDKRPVYAQMYKRAYFVDWPLLNAYRAELDGAISVVADGQWEDTIHWILYKDLQEGFDQIARLPVRARPWFAPGAWGGDWMMQHIPQLNKDEVNYAWSFELIVPENGLILESDGLLLEVPFDWLMQFQNKNILGKDASRFGDYFPIRFDFLDTFNGGNLSIQCHPSVPYIQEQFGEKVTQDETYYMLDCAPDAGVYLGFQEDIDPENFKKVLLDSQKENEPIDIEQYVQLHPAKKHDLFLIPNQTIHSSGKGNLVLEISATPYIFTFKLYDWVRPDLNGKPRPINIEHGYRNLNFSRKGAQVEKELISHPVLLESNAALQRWHLPTHKDHYYDIHRLEIHSSTSENTANQCHIMMVVEGEGIELRLDNGQQYRYNYAETFIIPAAVGDYQLTSPTGQVIKVIKAFVK